MYNNDYIIAVDENGSPYIAHANAAGGAAGAGKSTWGTRFIAKFPNLYRMGKTAYAYTQEQADAMRRHAQGLGRKARSGAKKAWGSKAGRWIDEHDAGISEEILRRRAKRKSRAAFKKGDAESARRYAHRAAELRDEAKAERQAAKNKIKDKLGYDERDRYRQTLSAYRQMNRTGRGDASKQITRAEVGNALDKYKDEYDRTILGRYENLSKRLSDITGRNQRRKGKRSTGTKKSN